MRLNIPSCIIKLPNIYKYLLFFMKKLLQKNLLIVNFKRMWPYIKPYWGRALLGGGLNRPRGGVGWRRSHVFKALYG